MSHYTFRMLALLQNPAWIWNGGWTISRNHSGIMLWVMTQAYAPFCSPLRHAELRCSPGAPALWTGAYCRSGKWSRQFWGGFCAHLVQNSCIHIKWRNCPDIKRWLINILPLVWKNVLLNWSICPCLAPGFSPHRHDAEAESPSFTPAESWSVLAGFRLLQQREMR